LNKQHKSIQFTIIEGSKQIALPRCKHSKKTKNNRKGDIKKQLPPTLKQTMLHATLKNIKWPHSKTGHTD
jgi:hypothetical protein